MQLVTVVSRALYRLLPHDTCTSGEWITSHTGYLSFRAVVREDENGRFHAFVSKRTGYTAGLFLMIGLLTAVRLTPSVTP